MLNQRVAGRVFDALGDPTRRQILEALGRGPASVSDLAKPLRVTLAAVMQHLHVLEATGLIRTHKAGRVRSCQLNADGFLLAERWLQQRRTFWESNFDRLAEVLGEDPADTRIPSPTNRAHKGRK